MLSRFLKYKNNTINVILWIKHYQQGYKGLKLHLYNIKNMEFLVVLMEFVIKKNCLLDVLCMINAIN